MSGATRCSRSARPRLTLAFVVACALVVPLSTGLASASPVTTAANIPHAGISPGSVNMATGELILVLRPDLYLDGPMPLTFGRYYASMLAREGLAAGHLGPNWLSTYDWRIQVGPTGADVITNEGQDIQFQLQPDGSWSLVHPTDQAYVLTTAGTGLRFTDPVSRRDYVIASDSGRLLQILDEHGNALTLTYAGGQLYQVTDGLGRALTFTHDPLGMLSSVSDGKRYVSFTYQGGALTGVTDAAGQNWTYAYSPAGTLPALLAAAIEPLGNAPVTQSYDPLGRVASQQDAASGVASYAYDSPIGNVFTDPLSHSWSYQHDSENRLAKFTDPSLSPWSFQYDGLGRLSGATRPLGDATTFEYDPASGYPSAIDFADATSIHWSYSSHVAGGATFFDLASTLYPDLSSSNCVRDAAGNLTDFTDRGGFHWHATYNARGQVLSSTNPATGSNTLTYDPLGRVATSSDPAGNLTTYGYDDFSRLVSVLHADLSTRLYAYDAMDRLTGVTDERGKTWSFAHDANGRLTAEADPLTHSTHYAYDPLDRVTQVTDPLGHSTLLAYDAGGRLAANTDRTNRVTQFSYDTWGNLTGVTDPANAAWGGSLDPDLRRTSASDPLGHAYVIGHDFMDRVTKVTDPVTTQFDYTYDAMGRLRVVTAPLGHSQTFTYDARGLMTSALDAVSETQYAHTPLGEIGQLTDPNHNPWQRGYDTQGRLASTADPLSRSSGYAYDSRSRLAHVDLPVGPADLSYDVADRLLGATFTGGLALGFTYDDANRLTSASGASFAYDEAGRMTGTNGIGIAYDDEGRITSESYGPGQVVSYTYDSRGLLAQVSDWLSGVTTFTYDAAHRLTGITRPNGTTATYAYDAADRLINAVESNPGPSQTPISSIAITRDALGQVSSIQRSAPILPSVSNAGTVSLAYDAASQVTGLTWDGLGRLTADGTRTFVWDGASRLASFTAGAESPSFTYDAFGNVLSRTQGSASEQYLWNYANEAHTLDVVVQGGLQTREYVHSPSGLLLYSIAGNARRYYHYDENGNTMFLTNDAGAVVANYIYSPTGEVSASGASENNPFTLGAAGGTLQLGTALFAEAGGFFDSRYARAISGGAFDYRRRLGYKFEIFAHDNTCFSGSNDNASGISELRGNDMTVSVGGTILHVSDTFVRKETGTFMHELGHNLNLVHGGDLGGRRPNYMSVMNYSYAYSGISRIVGRSPGVYDAPGTFATRFDGVDPSGTAGSGEVAGNDPTVSIGGSEFAGGGDGRIAVAPFGESLRLTIHDNSDPPHFTDYSVTEGGERCPWCKPGATGGSGLSWIRPGALNSEHPKLGGDRDPSHRYLYIGHGPILSALDLNQAGSGDSETTYTCVPPGSHLRIVVDRDTRGIVDDSQCKWCERP